MIKYVRKIITLFTVSLLFTGCLQKEIPIEFTSKNYNNKINIPKKEPSKEVENVKYYMNTPKDSLYEVVSSADIKNSEETQKNIINNEDYITLGINGESTRITYGELVNILNSYLTLEYKDYRITEHLIYNYSQASEKTDTGIYIDQELSEVRKNEQYYKDDKKLTGKKSFQRHVEAIKYKNRQNGEFYIAEFSTRQKDKLVGLDWKETNSENEETRKVTDLKHINLTGLTHLYEFIDVNNYKAKGKMPLKQLKEFLIIENTGTKTLRNIEAKPQRQVTEAGKTVEQEIVIRPLEFEFEYDLIRKDKKIILQADLTPVLKNYYKVFPNYGIINSTYEIVIEDIMEGDLGDEKIYFDESISTASNISTVE